jgi:hypothetical protein
MSAAESGAARNGNPAATDEIGAVEVERAAEPTHRGWHPLMRIPTASGSRPGGTLRLPYL